MKKIILFVVLLCAAFGFTQAQDATINANRVKYWVGSGNNQAIFIVNWCDPDTALAWGFKFSEDSLLVSDMLTAITTADSRLSYAGTLGWLTDLTYTSGTETFQISPDYIMYNVNGNYADVANAQYFHPGDYVKFGGYDCAVLDENWTATWTTPIEPVELPGVPVADATINASDIQYWVGTGSNEVVFIVSWCDPYALAWGYRFDGESVLVSDVLTAITTADPRLSYEGTPSWITDIVYTSGDQTYSFSPDYVTYNVNGGYADVANVQTVHAGDYVKFGGYGCAHMGESVWIEDPSWGDYWMYASVWTTAINPASVPTSVENYDSQTLSVYPNPCTESIRIQTNVNDDVVLYNLQGAMVMSTVAMDEITTLDVNSLPAGLYFVKSGNKTAKIVKR